MDPKHLYTIKWTQPYSTSHQRPYLRGLHQQMEQLIEHYLEDGEFSEAKLIIERIKNANKSN